MNNIIASQSKEINVTKYKNVHIIFTVAQYAQNELDRQNDEDEDEVQQLDDDEAIAHEEPADNMEVITLSDDDENVITNKQSIVNLHTLVLYTNIMYF